MTDVSRADALQKAWLTFIDSTPAVRVWNGTANFKLGPCGPDTAGGIYQGLGIMVQVPRLTIPLNGAYKGHTFAMSGVSPQMLAAVNAERDAIRGARLCFSCIDLDADMNPVAAPVTLWVGWIDSPRMERDGRSDPPKRTVSLVCSTGAVRRGVRAFTYYTPNQQAIIDPGDTSCMNVPTYAAGTDCIFPS
jgi:hypothetical protein